MVMRGKKMKRPQAKKENSAEIEGKKQDYKIELIQRYWEYQRGQFPDCHHYFERPFAQDGRPPVFLAHQAWRNVIWDPDATENTKEKLSKLISEGNHHKWFRSMNSSQALALSILGNLSVYDSLDCLSDLKDDEGENLFGEKQIFSEPFLMEHKIYYLGEPHQTSLDGYISGKYRIAIECKFTELEVGTCSRPRLKPVDSNYETQYCDGTYSIQKQRKHRCALTETGVLYWKYLPAFFKWGDDFDLNPCPLRKNYQLVRNILAAGVKEDGSVSIENGHVILIYDERNPAFMSQGVGFTAYAETRVSLKQPGMLRKCSWQRITRHIRQKNIFPWLSDQLMMKYGL
jgi:hypothetical protein